MAVNGTGSLVILVIVLLGALAFQAQVEGKPQDNFTRDKKDNFSRIIDHSNGPNKEPDVAEKGQFPWQVLVLTTKPEGIYGCGGSIIDQEWVMTAAHCIVEDDEDALGTANGYSYIATRVSLIAGVIDKKDEKNYGEEEKISTYIGTEITDVGEDQRVFIHKDYNTKIHFNNDIALCKLKKPLTLNDFVKPILLATAEDVTLVRKLTATGWGRMSYDAYKPYQSGKYWTFKQCHEVKSLSQATLETCKTYCISNKDCQVFLYTEDICILQNCNGPIPEPGGKKEGIIGYSKNDKVSVAHESGKFWTKKQKCHRLGKVHSISLENCKMDCYSHARCTHFRYRDDESKCALQRCPSDVSEPAGPVGKWIGYSIHAVYEAHASGNFWIEGEDECHSVEKVEKYTLENCKTHCTKHKGCTHFRYDDSTSTCDLQKCPIGISEPTGSQGEWVGYSIPGYRPHHWGKYWTEKQCPLLEVLYKATLEKCKTDCTSNDFCTVFFFEASRRMCGLQKCNKVIPEPAGSDSDFIGYSLQGTPQKLRYVADLDLQSKKYCDSLYGKSTLSENMICHKTPKKSIYKGDSGGAVTFEIKGSKPPINVQIGINSFVDINMEYSAVFTDVAKLRPWIYATMSGYSPPGFFISSLRWYRLIKDAKVTWEDAQSKCHEIGMQLAEPKDYHAVQLREDTFDKFGYSSEAWVGARGDSKGFTFVVSKAPVADSELIAHPVWPTDKHCLWLDATRSGLDKDNPYYATLCSNDYKYALCQVCDDPPDDQDLTSGQCEENGGRCIENGGTCETSIVNFVNSVDDKCVCCLQACSEGFRAIITRSGSKQCVLITSCPEDEDFFTLPVGGSKQCFKVLKELATWEKANKDCIYLNLTLAEPFAPVQLRSYIVQEYGPEFYVWLGACQFQRNKMRWQGSGKEIKIEEPKDPLWYPEQPNFDEGCLLLLSSKEYLEDEPDKPFWNVLSKNEFYPLCELVLA